jgi:butyrate kinase
MSFRIQTKKERLSPDVPWYQFSAAYRTAITQHNGSISIEEPDNLTTVTTLTFADEAAYNAFVADPVVVKEFADHAAYNNFAKIEKKSREL